MSSKIVIFTDVHLGETLRNKGGKNGVNTYGDNINGIKLLRNEILKLKPSFTVNLGDVMTCHTNGECLTKYKEFVEFFKELQVEHIIGNHEPYLLSFDELFEINHKSKMYSFEKGGFQHIFINPYENGEYVFSSELFEWLSKLIFREDVKSIIYSHFPISEDSGNLAYYHINNPERAFVSNSSEVREFLSDSNVVMFISGHTHFYFEKEIDGIKHLTVPSFSEDKDGKPACEFVVLDLDNLNVEVKKVN